MLNVIFSKIWGWVAGAAALVLAGAGLYLRGRSTGRAEERLERDIAVYQQQTKDRAVAKENEIETSLKSDSDITAGLIRDWVRNPEEGAGRD